MTDAVPLVSVVTPVLNCAPFIAETMLSVRGQDYPRVEHIVLTAGSTDGTTQIALEHATNDVRVVEESEIEQSPKVNEGFRLARGDIFGWLNGDDLYVAGAITAAVSELTANPYLGMVCADYIEIDERGCKIRNIEAPDVDLEKLLNYGNGIAQPTVFLRRSVVQDVGGLDEAYLLAQDYEFWLRVVAKFPVKHVPAYWALYRRHGGQLTSRRSHAIGREIRKASRAHGGRFFSEVGFTHSTPLRAFRRMKTSLRSRDSQGEHI